MPKIESKKDQRKYNEKIVKKLMKQEDDLNDLTEIVRKRMFYIYNAVIYRIEDMERHVKKSKEVLKLHENEPNILMLSLEGTVNHLELMIREYKEVRDELKPYFYK